MMKLCHVVNVTHMHSGTNKDKEKEKEKERSMYGEGQILLKN